MPEYTIAGLKIDIISDDSLLLEDMAPFKSSGKDLPDIKLQLIGSNKIDKPKGKIIIDDEITWTHCIRRDFTTCVHTCFDGSDEIASKLEVNADWSNAVIKYRISRYGKKNTAVALLCETLFRSRLLFHQGIVVHASAIQWEGKAIMFSAPSGTGKSTQANLWRTFMGAEVINDDHPAVRLYNGVPYVNGTPWSGSSGIFLNTSAPLSAIVILEQDKENSLFLLKREDALPKFMPRCLLPYHDFDCMALAMNTFEKIITAVPIFLLKCRPDRDAVRLVEQCVI